MDVDQDHIHKYDEYVRGPAREVITVETRIKPHNKGFAMLSKLGWTEGQPLGLSGDGRVDPIPFQIKRDLTGLGKTSQDVRMIETTVSQRRGLDSERQQKETEDQRKAREDLVARKFALRDEITTTLKAFYCSLCDKQFKNVAQYDEHTNSYAHHHKARFKDMQANVRLIPKEEVDKRKEKELKREEKQLRKIAAANGIKMPKPPVKPPAVPAVPLPTSSDNALGTMMEVETKPSESKGWASLSTTPSDSTPPQPGFRKSGWATVGSSSTVSPPVPFMPSTSAPSNASNPAPIPHHPSFRNAGWTTLDTGSSFPAIPTSNPPPPTSPPPPPPDSPRRGWSTLPPVNAQHSQHPRSVSSSDTGLARHPMSQPPGSGWQQFHGVGQGRR
ncbi:G-patch-domain Zn-finger DNA-binding protein [Laccaria bicolor S238N-H82]|uniref:G-patch-domain Zn-finger DNA-binding protein n=1 Tax=Laccaria bicolor (strain S238N-H82 / ATCC MYA-4686) TaxID=486041 RepID=B0CPB6_LACBS|nr:G-patch-domain Zn-finger DNA-binding protein [Laccaria bicolor S238N-H82]EDR15447.1 G-patch-domain Zn-finger DNA-binding protein [Laccaria bicolor S238N-H82]|eukprot:XP_001873655.1 G-patch-domain Zn-finger DNA-binding protein [Laccaria bicolor S238N-H82]